MPVINLTQAAKLAGIGRTTLYRKAKKGILSTTTAPDGSPGVDTSELFRVFPPKQHEVAQTEPPETVETQMALLKQHVGHLEELLSLERKRNDELVQAMKMISHRGNERPGFLARLFGRGER